MWYDIFPLFTFKHFHCACPWLYCNEVAHHYIWQWVCKPLSREELVSFLLKNPGNLIIIVNLKNTIIVVCLTWIITSNISSTHIYVRHEHSKSVTQTSFLSPGPCTWKNRTNSKINDSPQLHFSMTLHKKIRTKFPHIYPLENGPCSRLVFKFSYCA